MGKRKRYTISGLYVEKYAAEGKCIARHDDKIIFIEGAVPGDTASVFVHKNKKDWAEATVLNIEKPSDERVEAFCKHFGTCGGCKWQMLPYTKQLMYKEQQVKDQLQRIGNVAVELYEPILGAGNTQWYRNKLEFTFSTKQYLSREQLDDGLPFEKNVLGFHAPKLFDKVIDIDTCYLQPSPSNEIKNFVRDYAATHKYSFYDIKSCNGLLRTLMIRVSTTGQTLVNLVFGKHDMQRIEPLMQAIATNFAPTSLHYTINTKRNDSLYDQDILLFSGSPTIEEVLGEFVFDISPKSFFQTNTKQAEALYNVVKKMADCQSTDVLYDLYCGTGSIGIFLSKQVQKIVGVETIADAVEDAKKNAKRNNVENASFFAGDVIKVCDDTFFATHGKPDVVVIDPPRAGCHETLLNKLLDIAAPKIVYVSCNPATQARDLKLLSAAYRIVRSQAVDMFPHTHHIENVVLLVKS